MVNSGSEGKGWGIVLPLKAGWVFRPIRKFWTLDNPWKSGNHWFIIKFPCILPFLSVAYNDYGAYVGGKTFTVDDKDSIWAGTIRGEAIAPSASIRRTRRK